MNETINNKKGLNAFLLKILALIIMTFDHIHAMLASVLPIPVWFNMIGRTVAPIFIFMVANGMHHTRNKEKYILRLYIASFIMSMCNYLLGIFFPHPKGVELTANIFATMFLITLYIYIGGKIKETIKAKNPSKMIPFVLIGLVPIAGSVLFLPIAEMLPLNLLWILNVLFAALPSILFVEGGIGFIVLGIGFYLCSKNKTAQCIFYLIFCALIFVSNMGKGVDIATLFSTNFQWMMVFALPLILLYNGKRGRGMKYLFYFYYPIHIYLLWFIARAIA